MLWFAPIIADDTDIVDELFLLELWIYFFRSWAAAFVKRAFPPLKLAEFKALAGSRSKEFEEAAETVLLTSVLYLFGRDSLFCWLEKSEFNFKLGTLILDAYPDREALVSNGSSSLLLSRFACLLNLVRYWFYLFLPSFELLLFMVAFLAVAIKLLLFFEQKY